MLLRFSFSAIVVSFAVTNLLRAGTSNSLLDISPDGKHLLSANADNGSVTVVDTTTNKVVREIPVGEKPEGVTWIGEKALAAVTLYGESKVVLFNPLTGEIIAKLKTAAEPYGVVSDKQGKTIWVSHEYPGTVSEIDVETKKIKREIPAGTMVRGLALAPDEKRIYISEFYTGILRAIDLASGKEVDSWKGHSTDNLSRHVLLHPTRPKAYLAHIRSMVTVNHGAGSIFPQLSICDLKPGEERRRVSFAMDTFNGVYVVTNAWESAISPNGKKIYIIYAGTNDMNLCNVVDDDYKEIEQGRVYQLGENPRAVRVSPDSNTVYVYNALDYSVSVHNGETMQRLANVPVCKPPKTPEWVRGKVLFNTAKSPMSQRRWVSCSSCHPDGHHDGRVWQQPEGLRKTTAFFGMGHTHPLHFSADRDEVQDFEFTVRSPLMQGSGLIKGAKLKQKVGYHKVELEETTSGRSKDLDALAIYSNSFDPGLSPHLENGKLSAQAERGKQLFLSKEVGCATCHSGPYYSDSRLQKPYNLHDVGTGNDDKTERMGPMYDTPTLLGIYRTAPYLHHGKAKTLEEVITVHNKGDKHGKTSHLNSGQVADLVAFLKSLPYEPPPAITPNGVSFRLQPTEKK